LLIHLGIREKNSTLCTITLNFILAVVPGLEYDGDVKQDAQLSQKDCAMLHVIEYFPKSLKVI